MARQLSEELHFRACTEQNLDLSAQIWGTLLHRDDDPSRLLSLAEAAFRCGNLEQGVSILQEAYEGCIFSDAQEEEGNLSIDVCSTASRWLWRAKKAKEALVWIGRVDKERRTAELWEIYGSASESLQQMAQAESGFRECLRQQPLALASALGLLRCGADEAAVRVMCPELSIGEDSSLLLRATASLANFKWDSAMASLGSLVERIPKHAPFLAELGYCALCLGKTNDGIAHLQQVLLIDPECFQYQDVHAFVLYKRYDTEALGRLAYTLLKTNKHKPEALMAGAMYALRKRSPGRASFLLHEACHNEKLHHSAIIIQSMLMLDMRKSHSSALRHLRRAYAISKDPHVYAGLVDIYLATNGLRDALLYAKECLQHYPDNGLPFRLMGLVLARSHKEEGKEKAGKAFDKAVKLRPYCSDTTGMSQLNAQLLSLVKYYLANRKTGEAVEACQKYIDTYDSSNDAVLIALGDAHLQRREYLDAVDAYQRAFSKRPENPFAEKGLRKAEKLCRGESVPEEDEEEEEDMLEEERAMPVFDDGAFEELSDDDLAISYM